jgi:4-amino-4-deoxy-L-arabinose transferase-like glycosyltransferase
MKPHFEKLIEKPIHLLLVFNIVIGFFIFRDYGLSWDEPFFYDYGDALGYAYSPKEWFSGNFDLYNSYGASGDDHKTRGPAYLFLARNFVYGLNALGSDSASAWHLVNFLFFQLGIYFLYRLAMRWMNPSAAFFASAFFSFQPLLWGHAFINPKDPPFLTFFLASVCLGFEMVDAISENAKNKRIKILFAAAFLGIATSIRVLGPLAGLLVLIYSISQTLR